MMADLPVSVSPHRTLNSSKGVIRCRDLKLSQEEIIQEHSPQGVTDSHNITVLEFGIKRQTNTFISLSTHQLLRSIL